MFKKAASTLIATALVLMAAEKPASTFDEQVRAYLLEHPEVILESIQQYQAKQNAAKEEKAREAVTAQLEKLERDTTSPEAGNKDGVTVVEFFDYRCGYCKKVRPTITGLLASNPNVRVVYKELPILGPDSMTASKAALAAHKQGGYAKFHDALLATSEPISVELAQRLAVELGLDPARLAADMQSPEIDAVLAANRELAESLNVQATPTFVVGSQVVPGAVDLAKLESMVAQANKVQTASR